MDMTDPNHIARGRVNEIAPGVWYVPSLLANTFFLGERDEPWVLVDAGAPGMAGRIRAAARHVYGEQRPEAILLTHGHFDHVGSLKELAEGWDVPVFAHALEWPYLDGRDDYPPPDPSTGGLMAELSRWFPRRGTDIGSRLRALPMDFSVPYSRGWRFLHTPGHTPGHVSFFRDADRVLIAGDAIITIDQQNLFKLVSQVREFHPPPRYFTMDFEQAEHSVQKLADLRPEIVVTGHGLPIAGADTAAALMSLANSFWDKAPGRGRYVHTPARADEHGVYYVPPKPADPLPLYAAGLALAAVGIYVLGRRARREGELDRYE